MKIVSLGRRAKNCSVALTNVANGLWRRTAQFADESIQFKKSAHHRAAFEYLEELGSAAELKARTALSLVTVIVIAEFDYDRASEKGSVSEREFREAEMRLRDAGFVALEILASISAAYVAAKVALAIGFDADWAAAISAFIFTATVLTIGQHLGFFSHRP